MGDEKFIVTAHLLYLSLNAFTNSSRADDHKPEQTCSICQDEFPSFGGNDRRAQKLPFLKLANPWQVQGNGYREIGAAPWWRGGYGLHDIRAVPATVAGVNWPRRSDIVKDDEPSVRLRQQVHELIAVPTLRLDED